MFWSPRTVLNRPPSFEQTHIWSFWGQGICWKFLQKEPPNPREHVSLLRGVGFWSWSWTIVNLYLFGFKAPKNRKWSQPQFQKTTPLIRKTSSTEKSEKQNHGKIRPFSKISNQSCKLAPHVKFWRGFPKPIENLAGLPRFNQNSRLRYPVKLWLLAPDLWKLRRGFPKPIESLAANLPAWVWRVFPHHLKTILNLDVTGFSHVGVWQVFLPISGLTGFSYHVRCDGFFPSSRVWRVFPLILGLTGFFPYSEFYVFFLLTRDLTGFSCARCPSHFSWKRSSLKSTERPLWPHIFNLGHEVIANGIFELGLDVDPKACCIHQTLMSFEVHLGRFLTGWKQTSDTSWPHKGKTSVKRINSKFNFSAFNLAW